MEIPDTIQRLKHIFLLIALALPSVSHAQSGIQRVSANILVRQLQNGYSTNLKGGIYYRSNGNLVLHFTSPKEYIVITNNKGEARMYDPARNAVLQFQNFLFSSSITPFSYFFNGRTGDMGLLHAGYKLIDTKFDQNLVITTWQNMSGNPKDEVARVQLVHDGKKPIYMDYRDAVGNIIRKVYYYDYTALNGVEFPQIFTEILYQGKDSVINKTEYSGLKINNDANSHFFDYRIPENAKLESK